MTSGTEASTAGLPAGTTLNTLFAHRDERGWLVELDRQSAHLGDVRPVQWNALVSSANTLRGMHVHVRHTDWVTVIAGAATIALVDLRDWQGRDPAQVTVLELCGHRSQVLVIPPGVLHGFYTPAHSVLLNGVSVEFDPADDVAVRHDDVALGIDWAVDDPVLSERDRCAPALDVMFERLAERGEQLPSLRD